MPVFIWVVNDSLEMSECGLRKQRKREPIEKKEGGEGKGV
jgi:hypothetical protein